MTILNKLILASNSPRRVDLLKQIGIIPNIIQSSEVDENLIDKKISPKDKPSILPKFFKENGTWVGLLPGDEGYDDA